MATVVNKAMEYMLMISILLDETQLGTWLL